MKKKVFVSGCYDMLHSGHVAFFREAAKYGDLYVGIGSDDTIRQLKGHDTIYSEKERLYMVKAIRYVTDAFINTGSGMLDFVEVMDRVQPDVFVVNTDGGSQVKRDLCKARGIEYVELQRVPEQGLQPRSTTALRTGDTCRLPYRIDLAGTWLDQPYVSEHAPGWAITLSLEPTHTFMERGGMATSTRNVARQLWPYELPMYNEKMLARLLFCFENSPERHGYISGAQDALGICVAGLCRHYYDKTYWPSEIEQCKDSEVLDWLESHLCIVPMFPRREDCNVLEGKDITPAKAQALADAADRCWHAILARDLEGTAKAYADSFAAQVAMFPAMMADGVGEWIDNYRDKALAWKMAGAGAGGHLILVYDGELPPGALPIKIRRN